MHTNTVARTRWNWLPSGCYTIAQLEMYSFCQRLSAKHSRSPGMADIAKKHNGFIAGDDFKPGQTKFCLRQDPVPSGIDKPDRGSPPCRRFEARHGRMRLSDLHG